MSAAAWSTDDSNIVSKAVAKDKIMEMARDKELSGAFKVFYDGRIIADPEDLPEQVDLRKIKVSAVLDQA